MMGILKRKFSALDEASSSSFSCSSSSSSSSSSPSSSVPSPSSGWDSDRETPAALPLRSILKRPKLSEAQSSVCFDRVTVFSFPRCQGFSSVPSRGGATLGMSRRHCDVQTFTVSEHALEQRRRRREQLRERRRQERFQEIKHKLISSGAMNEMEAEYLTIDQVPITEPHIHINSVELEAGGFLQPFSSKQRQAILLSSGVKRIDKEEKRQLHVLRLSREKCGCDCVGLCEPETCACSLAGIKCQVDRFNFPCGCSQDGCGNSQGRIEFDSRRVRTHHFHTIMRLELEQRLKQDAPFPKDQTKEPKDITKPPELPNNVNSVTVPSLTAFSLLPEKPEAEETSCSSDMTVSSCSSAELSTLSELKSSHNLNICDNNNLHSNTSEPMSQNRNASTEKIPVCANDNAFVDMLTSSPLSNSLDENSLEDFPNTPSPSGDYYMDLSLSSDSDLEFFDSDYTSGLLHCSFKSQRPSETLDHLRLLTHSDSLPQDETSTYLLESLIGLTD